MTSLTFYGGVNEIGGNKILLEDRDTKVFLDFGMSFSKMGKYFEEFLQPRSCNALGDLIGLNIIPDIKGIYRNDLLKKEGRPLTKEPIIEGVLFTHPHADHCWHAALLHRDVPFYCTETARNFFKAAQEAGRTTVFTEVFCFRENFIDRRKKPQYPRTFKTFSPGKKFKIKDIEVLPISVDHSIPGAVGYVIYTPEGVIAYTGDLRLHGTNRAWTEEFIRKSAEAKPDILIIEGTRIEDNVHGMSEPDVLKAVTGYIKNTKQLALCCFPPRDIDRMNSFYKAAKANNRTLAISTKQMYLLELLKENTKLKIPPLKDLKVYVCRAGWGCYEDRDYLTWERKYLNTQNTITCKEIRGNQSKYVFYIDFFHIKELIDVKPKQGSNYIYSISEPFNEEMLIDEKRMKNWLNHFKLPRLKAHASGHACKPELKEIITKIKPKQVIPIHTEKPLMFKELYDKVKVVGVGEKVTLK